MEIHHSKHHNTYVTNLNKAEEAFLSAQESGDLDQMIKLTAAINFNGGGHANHTLFWQTMSPDGGGEPSGSLKAGIENAFGSFSAFKEHFSSHTATIQGSGWGWLCWNPSTKSLVFQTTLAQDNPTKLGLTPLLGLDVWEHAYYLNYQNRRPDYIGAWWNVVNWSKVQEEYDRASS